jgi:hypothetical protein
MSELKECSRMSDDPNFMELEPCDIALGCVAVALLLGLIFWLAA